MFKVFGVTFLVAAVAAGFYVKRDRHDTAWWQNECVRTDLVNQVKVAEFRLAGMDTGFDPASLDAARDEKVLLENQKAELTAMRRMLRADLSQQKENFAKFRTDRLEQLRTSAVGKDWKEFVSDKEVRFEDAKVVSVNDTGVVLRHRDGSARVRCSDLTESQRYRLGLEEGSAIAATEAEYKQAAAYETWVENRMEASAQAKASAEVTSLLQATSMDRPSSPQPRKSSDFTSSRPSALANPSSLSARPRESLLSASPRQIGRASARYSRPRYTTYYYNSPSYCYPAVKLYRPTMAPVFPRPPVAASPVISNPIP